MENSSFAAAAEWNDMYNEALAAYWTIMSECAPADFSVSETTITTVPGTFQYKLPDNCRAVLEVYGDEGNTQRRPILPVDGFSRAYYRAPQSADPIIVRYAFNAPVITDDTTSTDFGELGDAYVMRLMARDALAKEESDTSAIEMELARLEQKLRTTRQRDMGFAQRIRDIEATDVWLYPNSVKVRGYYVGGNSVAVGGDIIEFYQPIVPFP